MSSITMYFQLITIFDGVRQTDLYKRISTNANLFKITKPCVHVKPKHYSVSLIMCLCACARACVYICMCVYVCACVCVCVYAQTTA
jgi:hypothetical protein